MVEKAQRYELKYKKRGNPNSDECVYIKRDGYCYCSKCESEMPTMAGKFHLTDNEIRYCYFCGRRVVSIVEGPTYEKQEK